jgi:hypothetical protein
MLQTGLQITLKTSTYLISALPHSPTQNPIQNDAAYREVGHAIVSHYSA